MEGKVLRAYGETYESVIVGCVDSGRLEGVLECV